MLRAFLGAIAVSLTIGCSSPANPPGTVRAELAPTGKLRAGMNLGNTLFTTKDPVTGELEGVSVDLMRELASRLRLPVEFVVHATPGDVADAAGRNTWDVAILAIEPARAERIAFSPAITAIDATYAVPEGSALRSVAQVDSPGTRIAASEKAGYELYLSRTLRNATLVRTKGFAQGIELLNQRQVDALAGLRPTLVDAKDKMPGSRLLDGNFMVVNHGLAVPRDRRAAAEFVKSFVEEMNATGFVARSIERHGIKGLAAAR